MSNDVSVRVGLNSDALSTGLAKAQQSVDTFKEKATESFSEVGKEMLKGLAFGAVAEGVKGLFEDMDKLQHLSDTFGVDAEALQRLGQAAKEGGVSLEDMTKAFSKSSYNAEQAVKGNDKLADAFETMGINAQDFLSLPMDKQALAISDAFDKVGNTKLMRGALRDVLGKQADALIPVLGKGKAALEEMFNNANVASDSTVEKMADLTERVDHLTSSFKTIAVDAIGYVIDRVEALGVAAAVVVAFVSNIGHGLAAAKEAASEAIQDAADLANEKEQEAENKRKQAAQNQRVSNAIDDSSDADDKAADKRQKAIDELAAKNIEAANQLELKEEDAAARRKELIANIASYEKQMRDPVIANDRLQWEKLQEKRLADIKELDAANKEVARTNAEQQKQATREAEKAAKDRAKAEIDAKKQALTDAEEKLSKLDHSRSSFSVDSLRSIGGGLSGVNYSAATSKEDLQKQAVTLQKETVEQLKKAVKALEDKNRNLTLATGDGSFSLS